MQRTQKCIINFCIALMKQKILALKTLPVPEYFNFLQCSFFMQTESPGRQIIRESFCINTEDLPECIVEHQRRKSEDNCIVNYNHLAAHFKKVFGHEYQCKIGGEMRLQTTRRRGSTTQFAYKCTRCSQKIKFASHSQKQATELNKGIVWGSINIGIGHHQTQEMLSLMGVDTMSSKKYRKVEEEIYEVKYIIF